MENITPQEVKTRIEAGEKINLIDVREPSEHEEYNIGGTLYPLGKIQGMNVDELENLKDEEVICYCRSGNRSAQACLILETLGFSNTKNLAGGMLKWRELFS